MKVFQQAAGPARHPPKGASIANTVSLEERNASKRRAELGELKSRWTIAALSKQNLMRLSVIAYCASWVEFHIIDMEG